MELRIQETEDKKRSQNIGARKKKIENSKLRFKKKETEFRRQELEI